MDMKLRPWVKFTLGLIVISLVVLLGYKYYQKNNNSSTELLKENNIPKDKASETLNYVLENGIYDATYLEEYDKITYQDQDNFLDVIKTFLPKGYTGEEINYILALSNTNITKLKDMDYQNIANYYQIKNFNVSNIERYNTYHDTHDYSYADVVTYVNINLDLPPYASTNTVSDGDSTLVLVNKYNCLPKNYSPSDLDYIAGTQGQTPMRKVAKEALEELQQAVKAEANFSLLPTTAYRNYGFQSTLYNNYVAKDGVTAADTYSARPGCSEHQTGLAIDLKNPATPSTIRLTEANYDWLKNNAYRFGFIIRFPKDKEFITGYQEENWHIRYVGKDIAKFIYENNLTLEEYIDLYQTNY